MWYVCGVCVCLCVCVFVVCVRVWCMCVCVCGVVCVFCVCGVCLVCVCVVCACVCVHVVRINRWLNYDSVGLHHKYSLQLCGTHTQSLKYSISSVIYTHFM